MIDLTDPSSEQFGIAELAKRSGVTPRTIRYYVAEGLLPPPAGAGKYRAYNAEHVLRLQAIRQLKARFLPLQEIRRRLADVSREDLQRIARGASTTSPGGLGHHESFAPMLPDPLSTHQPSFGGAAPFIASLRPPTSGYSSPLRLGSIFSRPPRAGAEEPNAGSISGDALWHRATLAPGVELHYQLTGDRVRDEAIAHLVRTARAMLEG